jgi:hypothetical protein
LEQELTATIAEANYQAFDLAISAALCLGSAIYVAFWQA